MNAVEKYRQVVSLVAPSLKRERFAQYRNTFYLNINGNWGLIDFQKSKESKPDATIFAVNLGVASQRLLLHFSSTPPDTKPDIWDCQWRIRLGHLIENKDKWWSIDNETDIDQLVKLLQDYLLSLAVPEIKKYIDDESLRDLWLSGKSPSLTKIERLRYLRMLVKDLGPYDQLADIEQQLNAL